MGSCMRGCVRRGLSSARSFQAQTKFADADREGAVVDFEEHDGACSRQVI